MAMQTQRLRFIETSIVKLACLRMAVKPMALIFANLRRQLLARVTATRLVTTSADVDHPDKPDFNTENPYLEERKQCILCKHGIELDYKNTRLLSQFVSTFTGRVYDKHITGLCDRQQQRLLDELKKASMCHLMPVIHKNVKFMRDPALFDPFRPQRPNPH